MLGCATHGPLLSCEGCCNVALSPNLAVYKLYRTKEFRTDPSTVKRTVCHDGKITWDIDQAVNLSRRV